MKRSLPISNVRKCKVLGCDKDDFHPEVTHDKYVPKCKNHQWLDDLHYKYKQQEMVVTNWQERCPMDMQVAYLEAALMNRQLSGRYFGNDDGHARWNEHLESLISCKTYRSCRACGDRRSVYDLNGKSLCEKCAFCSCGGRMAKSVIFCWCCNEDTIVTDLYYCEWCGNSNNPEAVEKDYQCHECNKNEEEEQREREYEVAQTAVEMEAEEDRRYVPTVWGGEWDNCDDK
jgi:hypothetical protein